MNELKENNTKSRNKKKILIFFIKILISIIILFLIYLYIKDKITLNDFIKTISNYSIIEITILCSISLLDLVFRAYRWRYILSTKVHNSNFKIFLFPVFAAQNLNLFIPGKGGEFIKIIYLKEHLKTGTCLGSIIFERLIDFFWLFFLAMIGLFFFRNFLLTVFSIIGICGLLLIILILFNKKIFTKIKNFFFKFIKSNKIRNFIEDFEQFGKIIYENKLKTLNYVLMGLIQWIIPILQSFLIFYFAGVIINFFQVASKVPLGIVVTLLPISFGGLGTREAAFLFLFQNITQPEKIITFTIMFYLLRYLFLGIIGIPFLVSINKQKKNVLNNG